MQQPLKLERALLDPLASRQQVSKFCDEARENGLAGVALHSSRIKQAAHELGDSDVKISCLVGFPFGAADMDVKRFETEVAADAGAHEIYLVPAIALLKDGRWEQVLRELRDVVESADERVVKVFVEPNHLSSHELEQAVALVLDSGAQYIATSLSQNSAILDEIRRLRELAGAEFGIIATIPDDKFDLRLLEEAGANRALIANVSSQIRIVEQAFGM